MFGSFKAHEALATIGAVPVAPPGKRGSIHLPGYVIVRKDSGYKKIEDLKGKSFDFVSKDFRRVRLPMALLRAKKIDPNAFFSRMTFAGKHEISLSKVLNKESDGAAIKNLVFEKLARSDPALTRSSRSSISRRISRSDRPLPEGCSRVARQVRAPGAPGHREGPRGKGVLNSVGADRFIPTDKKDFAYLSKLVKQMEGK